MHSHSTRCFWKTAPADGAPRRDHGVLGEGNGRPYLGQSDDANRFETLGISPRSRSPARLSMPSYVGLITWQSAYPREATAGRVCEKEILDAAMKDGAMASTMMTCCPIRWRRRRAGRDFKVAANTAARLEPYSHGRRGRLMRQQRLPCGGAECQSTSSTSRPPPEALGFMNEIVDRPPAWRECAG